MENRTSGFTLVELMVVVVLIALVGLVATQIPLFGITSWRKGADRLRMQRDANLAMIKIQRKLRPAFNERVPNSYTLEIDEDTRESFFLDLDEKTLFYLTSGEATKELVIGGEDAPFNVTSFDVTNGDGIINIVLTLKMKRENVKTTLETAVKPRN